MSNKYLATPKPAPELTIPQSDKFVKVSIIDSTSYVDLPIEMLVKPEYKGQTRLTGPTFSFLIEHDSGKRMLFDLGIRKDADNMPPSLVNDFKSKGWTVKAEKNTADILQEAGFDIQGGDIDSVIYSHHHFDHVGDMTTFPSSTQLIVGPGFKAAHLPGYPINKDSPNLQSDFEGRDVREVDIKREGAGLKIGRFHAYDYFGDGSFYLLDTPGHTVGHMCGLARTSAPLDKEATFVMMGADACHHAGEFRPSQYQPLPTEISPSPKTLPQPVCPGHLLQEVHCNKSANEPYYEATEGFCHNLETNHWTVEGMQEFDASDDILLIIAHDASLLGVLDFFPESLNHWREKDLDAKTRWRFLGGFSEAVGKQ
ncbi:Metallo-hydrolase/oxidoreductase, partial [Aureobasidium melanogenum]